MRITDIWQYVAEWEGLIIFECHDMCYATATLCFAKCICIGHVVDTICFNMLSGYVQGKTYGKLNNTLLTSQTHSHILQLESDPNQLRSYASLYIEFLININFNRLYYIGKSCVYIPKVGAKHEQGADNLCYMDSSFFWKYPCLTHIRTLVWRSDPSNIWKNLQKLSNTRVGHIPYPTPVSESM